MFRRRRFCYALHHLVRSHLEYANSVWNSHRLGLITDLDEVQMRTTNYLEQPLTQF